MSSPRGTGGGGVVGNRWELDCNKYPQGGDFDPLIFQITNSRKEVNHLLLIL